MPLISTPPSTEGPHWTTGMILASEVTANALDVLPAPPATGRARHAYGDGPFARLKMPSLPDEPGLYVWARGDIALYVGQTRTSLRNRLGSNGYSVISAYNTYARQAGRTNGGQQTNCRINALANRELASGARLSLWYRTTSSEAALAAEAEFIRVYGRPPWNRQG